MASAAQKKGGRTALVTGASSGIGYELSKLFARDGYALVLVARGQDRLEAVAAELRQSYGATVTALVSDLSQPAAPGELLAQIQDRSIAVDVLVNNAGFATYGPFVETDAQEELDLLQTNMVALTHLTRLFLPAMLSRRRGRVLNVASTAAFMPGPLMAIYYASKAYVLSFSEALADEVRGSGVTVTVLCPGATDTGFQKRANLEQSRLFSRPSTVMDAATVAQIGYQGMLRGKPLVVPGLSNSALPVIMRLVPRALAPRLARRAQERVPGH